MMDVNERGWDEILLKGGEGSTSGRGEGNVGKQGNDGDWLGDKR